MYKYLLKLLKDSIYIEKVLYQSLKLFAGIHSNNKTDTYNITSQIVENI